MTIKKPMKDVAIADRFRLDAPDSGKKQASGGKPAAIAVVAGFLALVVAGVLTYVLWQHWEFLMPA